MEEKLEIVLNSVFKKYCFLFNEKREFKKLVRPIKRKFKDRVSLSTEVFAYYLMELEVVVRSYLVKKMQEDPFKVIDKFIKMKLKDVFYEEAFGSVVALCQIGHFPITEDEVKGILKKNNISYGMMSRVLKEKVAPSETISKTK